MPKLTREQLNAVAAAMAENDDLPPQPMPVLPPAYHSPAAPLPPFPLAYTTEDYRLNILARIAALWEKHPGKTLPDLLNVAPLSESDEEFVHAAENYWDGDPGNTQEQLPYSWPPTWKLSNTVSYSPGTGGGSGGVNSAAAAWNRRCPCEDCA